MIYHHINLIELMSTKHQNQMIDASFLPFVRGMVSAPVSGASGPGLSSDWGHCVVFLDSHIASLHPGVQMGTGKFNAGDNLAME